MDSSKAAARKPEHLEFPKMWKILNECYTLGYQTADAEHRNRNKLPPSFSEWILTKDLSEFEPAPIDPTTLTGSADGEKRRINAFAIESDLPIDYFAAKAMQTMIAGEGARMVANRDDRYDETNWKEIVASNAYDFAEAMIIERESRIRK